MSKGKKETFSDIDPILQELREYLRLNEIPTKKAAIDLHTYYLDSDKRPDTYYQRLIKLLSGEIKEVTAAEQQAIKRWIHTDSKPHLYGSILHSIKNLPGKIDQIDKYLHSSYVNRTECKRLVKELRKLNTLSESHISAETAQDNE